MSSPYYWTLTIEPGWIQCAIWTIDGDTTKVLTVGPATRWETDEDLIEATDASLSSAVSALSDETIEPSKTVFGVSPAWVSEGQIKREYLDKIRLVCNKLSLEPSGFVVLPEAIAHFVKSEEGSPLNGVVIGVGSNSLDIAVFKLGTLGGVVSVGRSVSVVDDVVEGLTRFAGADSLPSRFLLYNGKSAELEEVRQSLIKSDWSENGADKLKFLHTPQVEIVDPKEKVVAVSLAGASEIGEVSKVWFEKEREPSPIHEAEGEKEDELPLEAQSLVNKMRPEDVGFVVNKDISHHKPVSDTESLEFREPDKTDDNIKSVNLPHKLGKNTGAEILNKVKGIIPKFPKLPMLPKPGLKPMEHHHHNIQINSHKQKNPLFIGAVALVGFLLVAFLAWWFLPKAQVVIYVSPKILEKREEIVINENIPAQERELSVNGEKTASTTGKKTVGEKAKGKVEVRNGTAVGIKVNAGTILVGPNDLKFNVSNSASVSAASSPSSPGTAVLEVTADNIGSEYNLAKGEVLKVGNYPKSEVDAVVESDLGGGSSREITAVSADDLKSLEKDLLEELTLQGRTQFNSEVTSDQIFVNESVEATVSDRDFSNKAGDEASTVKLTLEVKLKGLIVSKSDLNNLAKTVLESQVPSGFILREEQINVEFKPRDKGSDGVWRFDANFTANLLPEIKPDEVAKKISGKYPKAAQSYLSTIPGFVRAQIKISPALPAGLGVLPKVVKNISIEVAAER